MNRALVTALALACVPLPAMAAGEVGTVGDTAVVFPWGAYLVAIVEPLREVLVTILVAVVMTFVARLGPMARMFITEQLVEMTMRKWIDSGLAATKGAVKGRTLNVELGSEVVAQAINRGLERADVSSVSKWAMDQAGGPKEVANKVIRMLPLEAEATTAEVADRALARVGIPQPMSDR